MCINGYISEKIFDSMSSWCVPIYWGAENITKYVPENCFIDRRKFDSNLQMYEYLKSIDQSEYDEYIENIRNYLSSDQYFLFSWTNFIHIFISVLYPDYNKN